MARQRINLFQYYFSQILVIILLFDCGTAHLRLTYPLGRRYDLDFLDNVRTRLPCGMPAGKYLNVHSESFHSRPRCGSRIWSRGGPASEAESCRRSEVESHERSKLSAAGVQGPLKGPGSFWVFDAQICILTHSRDSFSLIFDIYFDTKS